MKIDKKSGMALKRIAWCVGVAALCIGLLSVPGRSNADDGSGSKDGQKSDQKMKFIVGPITTTPDKGKGDKGAGGGQPGGQGGSTHHQ